jgi:hypothetical protein
MAFIKSHGKVLTTGSDLGGHAREASSEVKQLGPNTRESMTSYQNGVIYQIGHHDSTLREDKSRTVSLPNQTSAGLSDTISSLMTIEHQLKDKESAEPFILVSHPNMKHVPINMNIANVPTISSPVNTININSNIFGPSSSSSPAPSSAFTVDPNSIFARIHGNIDSPLYPVLFGINPLVSSCVDEVS